jgi:hypothetical protein
MLATPLRCLVTAAAIALAAPVARAEANASMADCELPGGGVDPLTNRSELLAEYERLPNACLQAIFQHCNTAASRTLLDFGSAAVCSFGYEAWLKKGFGGNFRALMAWWQTQGDMTPPR